jgi:hypothetical protein
MPFIDPVQYVRNREAYAYDDRNASFEVVSTSSLPLVHVGVYRGIFAGRVPPAYLGGITLRRFERIVQAVFTDALAAEDTGETTTAHTENLRSVVLAIVHWKMASQGGRASRNVHNVNNRWREHTHATLLRAYRHASLCEFMIDGVRVATASAFLRFLYPEQFGIIDRRVVEKTNPPNGITTMHLRNDGYILDVRGNVDKYTTQYVAFLRTEANGLNAQGISFRDIDETGATINSPFRPCDVEMALFV